MKGPEKSARMYAKARTMYDEWVVSKEGDMAWRLAWRKYPRHKNKGMDIDDAAEFLLLEFDKWVAGRHDRMHVSPGVRDRVSESIHAGLT